MMHERLLELKLTLASDIRNELAEVIKKIDSEYIKTGKGLTNREADAYTAEISMRIRVVKEKYNLGQQEIQSPVRIRSVA